MALADQLPHWFLVLLIVVVAFFVLKSLVKLAIIIGAVGLFVYLIWVSDVFDRFFAVVPGP